MFKLFQKDPINSVHVTELEKLFGKINLVDVREPYEYKSGHLPTAKNVPLNMILSEPERHLDKSKTYHIICQSGARSSRACRILKGMGFQTINVSGGTGSYRGNLER